MNKRSMKRQLALMSVPAIIGFLVLYLIPFIRSGYYSLIQNTHTKVFVGLQNYAEVLGNKYFRLALRNAACFSVISVGLLLAIAIGISYLLMRSGERNQIWKRFFVLPMVLPTAGVIAVWQSMFQNAGYDRFCELPVLGDAFVLLPVYLLFLWKNTGLTVVIITSALLHVPGEVSEAAELDGISGFAKFRRIFLPLVVPELFFAGMLAFTASLKIYKESSLYFGTDYPPDAAYTLQYYMNNHFHKLNYQVLTTATVIFTLLMLVIVGICYRKEQKLSGQL